MGRDQNLREFIMNVISRFTLCKNREFREWQFSLFFMIMSDKLANFCVISRKITKITKIRHEWHFTIQT